MSPQAEEKEIYEIMADYGLDRECVRPLVENLMFNKDMWVKVSSLRLCCADFVRLHDLSL